MTQRKVCTQVPSDHMDPELVTDVTCHVQPVTRAHYTKMNISVACAASNVFALLRIINANKGHINMYFLNNLEAELPLPPNRSDSGPCKLQKEMLLRAKNKKKLNMAMYARAVQPNDPSAFAIASTLRFIYSAAPANRSVLACSDTVYYSLS